MGLSYSEVGVDADDEPPPPPNAPTMSLHELREGNWSVNRGTERGCSSAEHHRAPAPAPSAAAPRDHAPAHGGAHAHGRRPRAFELMAHTIDPTGAMPPMLLSILVINTMLIALCVVLLVVKKA
jgi:hypothetical protein